LREHRAYDLCRLFELVLAHPDGREGNAVLAILLLVPACPEARFQAAIADMVNRSKSFGQHRRMPVTYAKHQAAYPHPAGFRRQQGEGGYGLETRAIAV